MQGRSGISKNIQKELLMWPAKLPVSQVHLRESLLTWILLTFDVRYRLLMAMRT